MAALDSRLHAVDSGFRELGIPGFVTKVELGFSNRKEDSGFYKQTFLDSIRILQAKISRILTIYIRCQVTT